MGGAVAPPQRLSLPCPSEAWLWLVPWSTAPLRTNCAPPACRSLLILAAGTKSASPKTQNPNNPHGSQRLRPQTAPRFLPSNVLQRCKQCAHPTDPASRYSQGSSCCRLPPLLSTAPCPIRPSAKPIFSASAAMNPLLVS